MARGLGVRLATTRVVTAIAVIVLAGTATSLAGPLPLPGPARPPAPAGGGAPPARPGRRAAGRRRPGRGAAGRAHPRAGRPPRSPPPVPAPARRGGWEGGGGPRLSGSRFAYRVGAVALVELALYRYALDRLVAGGFLPVLPPVLVREEAMYGTGFLPTEEANLYRVEPDGIYLTGTSEVALAGFHLGEILEDPLPLRYAGYSTCFRREAGAAGRDTRGVFRVHQFDKVEMFVWTTPEASAEEHEALLGLEESLVTGLGLAYRIVNTAANDLGAPAAKKYDIEAWIPSQERYREITSCSNTTDYQARRLGVRYREESGGLRHPHTLNGTAMTARWLIALLETYQDEAGAVAVPEALWPHGAPKRIEAAARP